MDVMLMCSCDCEHMIVCRTVWHTGLSCSRSVESIHVWRRRRLRPSCRHVGQWSYYVHNVCNLYHMWFNSFFSRFCND